MRTHYRTLSTIYSRSDIKLTKNYKKTLAPGYMVVKSDVRCGCGQAEEFWMWGSGGTVIDLWGPRQSIDWPVQSAKKLCSAFCSGTWFKSAPHTSASGANYYKCNFTVHIMYLHCRLQSKLQQVALLLLQQSVQWRRGRLWQWQRLQRQPGVWHQQLQRGIFNSGLLWTTTEK